MSSEAVLIADERATVEELAQDMGVVWDLIGAYIVFFMQCGFAMLEAGTVRKQNTVNILLKNLLDSCVAAAVWWAVGFPLAYGEGSESLHGFVGGSNFFMSNVKPSENPTFFAQWIFQWAFASTSATIVSGAAAERCRHQAYVIYTIALTGFVYPVVVHWAWSDWGWLSASRKDPTFEGSLGFLDYAGGSVVHVTGGGAAFFAAWFLGPRVGRFDAAGRVQNISPNSQSLIMLGAFILWFGWYAFNSVSGLQLRGNMITASLAAVNTTLSAASASLTVITIHVLQGNTLQIAPALNGLLAGLVGVTAGCAVIEPFAACIVGAISGTVYYITARLLLYIGIDDPLEASAVHFGPGMIGTLAVGFFATETNIARAYWKTFKPGKTDYGVFYGGDGRQLSIQLLGTLVIAFWTCAFNLILFSYLDYRGTLRVAEAEELEGLNASIHSAPERKSPRPPEASQPTPSPDCGPSTDYVIANTSSP